MHAVADVQDTSPSTLNIAPLGFGLGWMLHVVPFHCSTSVASVLVASVKPTAVHAVADEHETSVSKADTPVGFAVVSIVQAVPFHLSARVVAVPLAELLPTAVQAVAAVHETRRRRLVWAPAGLGVGTMVHAVPFQVSASVAWLEPLPLPPTAKHDVDDVHARPPSALPVAPVGLGVA
jgi:hypothetical protein